MLSKDELLAVYDETVSVKPRKNPRIIGYPRKGGSGAVSTDAAPGGEGGDGA